VPWDKAFDPVENEKVAIRYFAWIKKTLARWMGRPPTNDDVLAAYSGGIGRYRKHGYKLTKMPRETREYVAKFHAFK